MVEPHASIIPRAVKVVVIDDSVSVYRAIERMLQPRGLTVVGIHSAAEALRRLENERPDLVICDLVLPDVHGLEVCHFVRASAVLGQVPLLVVSGLADPKAHRQALEAGADAVLKKPFSSGDLATQVEALLEAGSAPPEPLGEPEPPWPAVAQAAWKELARLPALVEGSFRSPRGTVLPLPDRTVPKSGSAIAPWTVFSALRSALGEIGLGEPELVLIEAAQGGVLVLAHQAERGTVIVRLADRETLGKARHLARTLLRALAPGGPGAAGFTRRGPAVPAAAARRVEP